MTTAAAPPAGAELDLLADVIAYGIILAAVAQLGATRRALAAAVLAVALSDAFGEPSACVHGVPSPCGLCGAFTGTGN